LIPYFNFEIKITVKINFNISGQECPLYTGHSIGRITDYHFSSSSKPEIRQIHFPRTLDSLSLRHLRAVEEATLAAVVFHISRQLAGSRSVALANHNRRRAVDSRFLLVD
jgi:hypothetical protein